MLCAKLLAETRNGPVTHAFWGGEKTLGPARIFSARKATAGQFKGRKARGRIGGGKVDDGRGIGDCLAL